MRYIVYSLCAIDGFNGKLASMFRCYMAPFHCLYFGELCSYWETRFDLYADELEARFVLIGTDVRWLYRYIYRLEREMDVICICNDKDMEKSQSWGYYFFKKTKKTRVPVLWLIEQRQTRLYPNVEKPAFT